MTAERATCCRRPEAPPDPGPASGSGLAGSPDENDTILAVGTAPGASSLALLRLSGRDALEAVAHFCTPEAAGRLRVARGGCVLALELLVAGALARARALVFRAPRSLTREDLVELSLPGSPPLVGLVARGLLAAGTGGPPVRLARPGELTLRAFRSGRLDLSQVESLAAVISAAGEAEARAALRGLRGELGDRFRALSSRVLSCLALLEAGLDFPDEDLPVLDPGDLVALVDEALADLRSLARCSSLRAPSPDALRVALCGFPNAGKSTLLNAIVGREAAITSPVAGTTRDPVRVATFEGGRRLEWIDLAGLTSVSRWALGGETEETREIWDAVRRLTRAELERCDWVVWVVDPTGPMESSLGELAALGARRHLVVLTRADLLTSERRLELEKAHPGALLVSGRTGAGVPAIASFLCRHPEGTPGPAAEPPLFLISALQLASLARVEGLLSRARSGALRGLGHEYLALDLREALATLDEILGTTPREAVLDWIFSRFCLGK